MIIETERLYFEPLGSQDLDALKQILQNGKTMESYGGVRSDEECSQWIDRQQQRYEQLGYGIWSILRKDTRQMIGQGGLVYHNWKKEPVLDLVYIIKNEYWQQGYGKGGSGRPGTVRFRNARCRRSQFDHPGHE